MRKTAWLNEPEKFGERRRQCLLSDKTPVRLLAWHGGITFASATLSHLHRLRPTSIRYWGINE